MKRLTWLVMFFPALAWGQVALNFDGADDYISYPHNAAYSFLRTGAFSISVWVHDLNGGVNNLICGKVSSSANIGGYYIQTVDRTTPAAVNDAVNFFLVGEVGGTLRTVVYGNVDVADGGTHHIVCGSTGGTGAVSNMFMYIDGVSQSLNTFDNDLASNTITNNKEFIVGARLYGTAVYADGVISEVLMWNRAITAGEVQAIYVNRNAPVPREGLVFESAFANTTKSTGEAVANATTILNTALSGADGTTADGADASMTVLSAPTSRTRARR